MRTVRSGNRYLPTLALIGLFTQINHLAAAPFPSHVDSRVVDGEYVQIVPREDFLASSVGADNFSIGDLNGDGTVDVATQVTGAALTIVDGVNGTVLVQVAELVDRFNSFRYFSAGDVDGDGDGELLVVINERNLRYIEGKPDLSINAETLYDLPAFPIEHCNDNRCYANGISDFDSDGLADIVVIEDEVATMLIYGNPSGLPAASSVMDLSSGDRTRLVGLQGFGSGLAPWIVGVGDMNGDLTNDLALYRFRRNNSVVYGTPGNRKLEIDIDQLDGENGFVYKPLNVLPNPIFYGDFNGDGLSDISEGEQGASDIRIDDILIIAGHRNQTGPASPQAVLQRNSPTETDFYWQPPNNTDNLAGYRITSDSGFSADYSVERRSAMLDRVEGSLVYLQSIDSDGLLSPPVTMEIAERRPRDLDQFPSIRAEVYGPNLIEIILDDTFTISGRVGYTVWRNGEAIGNGFGNSYLDETAMPNQRYEYVVSFFLERSPTAVAVTSLPAHPLPAPLQPPRPPIPYSTDTPALPDLNGVAGEAGSTEPPQDDSTPIVEPAEEPTNQVNQDAGAESMGGAESTEPTVEGPDVIDNPNVNMGAEPAPAETLEPQATESESNEGEVENNAVTTVNDDGENPAVVADQASVDSAQTGATTSNPANGGGGAVVLLLVLLGGMRFSRTCFSVKCSHATNV